MAPLFYFISGILFFQFIIPILDSLVGWLLSYIEVKKGKHSISIAEMNEKLTNLTTETNTSVIGFSIPTEEEDDYE